MKYKIKIVEFEDGTKKFYPMVKKHWYSPWKYILSYKNTSFFKGDGEREERWARNLIESHRGTQVARTSCIAMCAIFATLILASCNVGVRQSSFKIQKSTHITCNGDTIVTFGGDLYYYSNGACKLDDAIQP